jgi:hypothetical protein
MGGSDSRFVSARSASRSQLADILVRLTLVSGSKLLCAISAQCAACSRYVAAFSLLDIQFPHVLSTHSLKLRHRDLVPHCTMLAGLFKRVPIGNQKTLSCQSLRKFNFHTFATIWLPLYLG